MPNNLLIEQINASPLWHGCGHGQMCHSGDGGRSDGGDSHDVSHMVNKHMHVS